MESLSPNLFVNDIVKSIAFYKLLGFEVSMSVPEQAPFCLGYDEMRKRNNNGTNARKFKE